MSTQHTCVTCGKPLEPVTYPELPGDVFIGKGPPILVENADGSESERYQCETCFDNQVSREVASEMERLADKE